MPGEKERERERERPVHRFMVKVNVRVAAQLELRYFQGRKRREERKVAFVTQVTCMLILNKVSCVMTQW